MMKETVIRRYYMEIYYYYKTYFLLLLIVIGGCNSPRRLVGTYLSSGSDATSSEQITLAANGEFKITSRSDVAGYFYANGTWRRSRDTVYFEVEPIKTDPLESYYSYSPDSDSVTIEAYYKKDTVGIYFAQMYLNGSTTPMDTIRTGVFVAKADSIQSIRMHLLSFDGQLAPPLFKSNRLTLYWDFTQIRHTVLVCKTRAVRGRKLFPLEPGFSVYRKKKRIFIRIFQAHSRQ